MAEPRAMVRLAGLAALIGMLGTSPAMAKEDRAHPDAFAVEGLHNFATCVVTNARRGAIQLLAMDFRKPDYQQKMRRITAGSADSCGASFRISSSSLLLAGALAERLITEKGNADQFASAVAYDAAKPPIQARSEEEMIGMCLSRTAPKESWAVLASAPGSGDESAAMQALTPTLTGCVAAGKPVRMNRPALRAMIALGAYQLEHPIAADGAVKGS